MEICHVCKKEKKPYLVILDSNIMSMINHDQAREKGPICQRCDNYFAMTGEFKDATEDEYEVAKDSCKFVRTLLKWWEKDKKIGGDYEDDGGYLPDTTEEDKREWGGTVAIREWYRKEFALCTSDAVGSKK